MANERPYFLFKPVTDMPRSQAEQEEWFEERKAELDRKLELIRTDAKQVKTRSQDQDNDAGDYEEEILKKSSDERAAIMSEKAKITKHQQLFASHPERNTGKQYTDLYNQFGSIMDELIENGKEFRINPESIAEEEEKMKNAPDSADAGVSQYLKEADSVTSEQQHRLMAKKNLLEEGVEAASLVKNAEGDLELRISLLHPAGTTFSICNGRVSFDASDMDRNKMLAMVDFLQRRGLPVDTSSLKLENADEQTTELFDDVVKELEEKDLTEEELFEQERNIDEDEAQKDACGEGHGDDDNDNDVSVDEDFDDTYDDTADDDSSDDSAPKEPEEEKNIPSPVVPEVKKAPKKQRTPEELHKEVCNAIRVSFTKLGDENFRWRQGFSVGGWTTFTLYDSDSIHWNRHEADIDGKNKNIKLNYKRKYWVRVHNGRLEFAYSGQMSKDDIYEFVSQLYGCGVKYVRFEGIPEEQETMLRIACGKRLIIPVGHKITAERYGKMSDAAGQKYGTNNPQYHRYRYDLAQEMRAQLRAKGIDDPTAGPNRSNQECREIRWAEAAYRLYPFRNMWEDYGRKEGNGLRYLYEDILAQNTNPNCNDGAANVIGAKLAFARLFDAYEGYGKGTIAGFINNPNLKANEKAALAKFVKENGISISQPVHPDEITGEKGMNPLMFEVLYREMCKTEAETARAQIRSVYFEKLKGVGRNQDPEQYAVKQVLENAERQVRAIGEVMEKEFSFPRLTVIPGGIPRHNFESLRKEARRKGLLRNSGYDDGYMSSGGRD